jgi:hypothetical protein
LPRYGRSEPPPPERRGPVPQEERPFVIRQDIGNIERQQIGRRGLGFDCLRISPRYEPMNSNMH